MLDVPKVIWGLHQQTAPLAAVNSATGSGQIFCLNLLISLPKLIHRNAFFAALRPDPQNDYKACLFGIVFADNDLPQCHLGE